MAKKASFDDLIQSIQAAFIKVNDMSEEQHLKRLETYFEPDGTPKTFDIQYPYFDENGIPAYRFVSIPQICLLPITTLKLDEINVDFKIRLYGDVGVRDRESDEMVLGYIPGGRGRRNEDNGYANIKLKFVSQDPPEGLMRVRDEFTKISL